MSMDFCDNCGDLIDTDYVSLHSIEFLSSDINGLKGNWCVGCIDGIPEGVKMRLDGVSSIYRDGMLIVLN